VQLKANVSTAWNCSIFDMQMGDMVAALVKGAEEEENWILAEVVQFNAATNKYEVDDIDEEQKDRHTLSRRRVVPLPLMRANPETDPHALFPKGSVGLYSYFVLKRENWLSYC